MTQTRADALARLDVFIGYWSLEARFPGQEPAGPADGGEREHDFVLSYHRAGTDSL